MTPIERVRAIMAQLRDPDSGCPWDIAQDFASIAPHTIEEAYEVADAIERGDTAGLRDELGDLLLQVVYHAQMAHEAGHFDFDEVATGLADKLVRRHPHVFGTSGPGDESTREADWEAAKAAERARKGETDDSALAGVTRGLPAPARAQKLSKRAARAGFDWPDADGPAAKVREELAEVARAAGEPAATEAEIGDLLFAAVNLARHHGVDAETALRRANDRFEQRFRALEAALAAEGRQPQEQPLDELERRWQRAKTDPDSA